jgi:hypothetical protein
LFRVVDLTPLIPRVADLLSLIPLVVDFPPLIGRAADFLALVPCVADLAPLIPRVADPMPLVAFRLFLVAMDLGGAKP